MEFYMSSEASQPKISILSTGLALFSMFFGAGNLVFPLIIGKSAGDQTPAALMGLGLSAVVFPFLGLIAMMLYGGDLKAFLHRLGKWPAFALMFVLYMSQGPFGSMPRLITLMYASVEPYAPVLSLSFFSILMCAALFFMTFRKNKIIELLGVILTPILLLTLAALVFVGMWNAPQAPLAIEGASHHFTQGLKGGYQTLDLIAALLFATVIMPHLAQGTDPKDGGRQIRRRMTQASLIAAGLLMASYIGLCWLSAHHSWTLGADIAPVDLLHAIAHKILGPIGGLIATIAVFMACLTTAISLGAVFADYMRQEIFKEKVSSTAALLITLGATALMANLGFTGIMKILSPVLEILYPGLIVLCLVNIAHSLYRLRPIKAPVFLTLAFASAGFFLNY
jgi:LIVCS family branched-chain amino acid:cation transporter